MFAPNLVYATVAGRYPRLLADDGLREPLVLPYSLAAVIVFEFYAEASRTPIAYDPISIEAIYIQPDGEVLTLPSDTASGAVAFSHTLPAGGLCVIKFRDMSGKDYQAYPFRVLRPTEGLTP